MGVLLLLELKNMLVEIPPFSLSRLTHQKCCFLPRCFLPTTTTLTAYGEGYINGKALQFSIEFVKKSDLFYGVLSRWVHLVNKGKSFEKRIND